MSDQPCLIYLVRHGGTAWTATGQHTGRTDLPLTPDGECEARRLVDRLKGIKFVKVFTSPLQRAARTCELAGFGASAQLDGDLVEWNYGTYDGRTSAQIRDQRPDWDLFRDGCPGGESAADIAARANRFVHRLRQMDGNVLIFSHSHFLRVLAACWLGLDASAGRYLFLETTAVSIVGYEHGRHDPVIRMWNDRHHLRDS
jgi:probable phosphoglycerate mutase